MQFHHLQNFIGNEIINKLEPRLQTLIGNTIELDEHEAAKALRIYEALKKTQHGGFPLKFEPEVIQEEEGKKETLQSFKIYKKIF